MERYESKHVGLMQTRDFFQFNLKAWMRCADNKDPRKAAYARRTAAMYKRLGKNAHQELVWVGKAELINLGDKTVAEAVDEWQQKECEWMNELICTVPIG